MKKIPKSKVVLRVADVLRDIGVNEGLDLSSVEFPQKFGEIMRSAAAKLQASSHTIHGKRIESLFPFVVAQLGNAKLITEEGAGEQWAKNDVVAPDWRVVLSTGENLLIEVKNFFKSEFDIETKFSVQKKDFDSLNAYAELAAVPLFIATYWAKPSLWTLLPASAFKLTENRYSVELETAIKDNEMSMLGDFFLAVPRSLIFRLEQDVVRETKMSSGSEYTLQITRVFATDADGKDYSTGGANLTLQLSLVSGWDSTDSFRVDGRQAFTDFKIAPHQPPASGLAMAGAVSTLLTREALFETDDPQIKKLSSPEGSLLMRSIAAAEAESMPIGRYFAHPNSKPYEGSYLHRTQEARQGGPHDEQPDAFEYELLNPSPGSDSEHLRTLHLRKAQGTSLREDP